MPCTLAIAHKAFGGLQQLDPRLQEETLDEIEHLAADPSPLRRRSAVPAKSYDFVRQLGDAMVYVFLTVDWDEKANHLNIVDIGHFARMRSNAIN